MILANEEAICQNERFFYFIKWEYTKWIKLCTTVMADIVSHPLCCMGCATSRGVDVYPSIRTC